MRKFVSWLDKHVVEVGIGWLLFFIPLWPKLPLFNVAHTWTYIRLEDFFIALVVGIWAVQVLRGRFSLRSPLTFPIFVYWLVGGISLVYSLVVLAPHLANFFPNVALLHYLRRIEYMILFLVVFSSIKNLKQIKGYLLIVTLAAAGVLVYGLGQRFFGLPAFLTMNEEFAKGIPLYLPPGARITATFGGHYDLAAYLVMMVPLMISLALGVKKNVSRIIFLLLALGSLILLLFTASRISFAVYLLAVSFMFVLHKKKVLIVPTILISILVMSTVKGAAQRFYKTLRVQNVVYDTRSGQPIATLEKAEDLGKIVTEEEEIAKENLPLGTGFVALPVFKTEDAEATQTAVIKRPVKISEEKIATYSATALRKLRNASEITAVSGSFLIQKALVYDISFTTRFQGEWPRALEAFQRNHLLGSGYSTISLATDNDYLRLLGETGILGLASFLFIFLTTILWARAVIPKIKDPLIKSTALGILGGLFGLGLNAIFIDVFEASKVALTVWPLMGILVAIFSFHQKRPPSWSKAVKDFLFSPLFTVLVLGGLSAFFFKSVLACYFVGDDFTWLRQGAEGSVAHLLSYLTLADGFFYRPLGKILFFLSYAVFWLKPAGYHLIGLLVHLGAGLGVYYWVRLVLKNKLAAFLASLFFVFHSIHAESLIWISGMMILLAGFFGLWSLVAYEKYQREGKKSLFCLSLSLFFLGLLSHELLVVFPLLIAWSDFSLRRKKFFQKKTWLRLIPFGEILLFYLALRWLAGSHWFSGDYRFNFKRLPFNLAGNFLGYLGEFVLGKTFIPFYEAMRTFWRTRIFIFSGFLVFAGGLVLVTVRILRQRKKKVSILSPEVVFGLGFVFLALLSVLGLGNIAERYTYLALAGFSFLVAHLVMTGKRFLTKKNPHWAPVIILLIVIFIFGFYQKDFDRFETEWQQAGEVTFNTLAVLRQNYPIFPQGSTLFFVDVPIRIGRAWVFPVGLEDALWFVYRDVALGIRKESDPKQALKLSQKIDNSFVFQFDQGILKELEIGGQ